jgi:hypothetical protein
VPCFPPFFALHVQLPGRCPAHRLRLLLLPALPTAATAAVGLRPPFAASGCTPLLLLLHRPAAAQPPPHNNGVGLRFDYG